MSFRIDGIENPGRTASVSGYTKEERIGAIEEFRGKLKVHAEIKTYLAQYSNPDNLSFAELLEQEKENLEKRNE